MISKKILFNVILVLTLTQSMNSADHAPDRIFSLLNNSDKLQQYLIENPHAIHATTNIPSSLEIASVLKFALMYYLNPQTVEILLNAGANPNDLFATRNINGNLLHYLAHRYNDPRASQDLKNRIAQNTALLILYGANDTIQDANGQIPMEISPQLIMHIDTIIQAEQQKEKLAHAAFMAELRPNTKIAAEGAQLLGHRYPSENAPQ